MGNQYQTEMPRLLRETFRYYRQILFWVHPGELRPNRLLGRGILRNSLLARLFLRKKPIKDAREEASLESFRPRHAPSTLHCLGASDQGHYQASARPLHIFVLPATPALVFLLLPSVRPLRSIYA